MGKKIESLLLEMLGIIIGACLLALIYNFFLPKPFPLFPKNPDELTIKDSELFNDESQSLIDNLEKTVTYEQVAKLINNPDVVFIDARTEENYSRGYIGNAVNIYPNSDEEEFVQKIMQIPMDKTIICYCDGGTCDLSHIVAEELIALGFKRVFLYSGGWEEWEKKRRL